LQFCTSLPFPQVTKPLPPSDELSSLYMHRSRSTTSLSLRSPFRSQASPLFLLDIAYRLTSRPPFFCLSVCLSIERHFPLLLYGPVSCPSNTYLAGKGSPEDPLSFSFNIDTYSYAFFSSLIEASPPFRLQESRFRLEHPPPPPGAQIRNFLFPERFFSWFLFSRDSLCSRFRRLSPFVPRGRESLPVFEPLFSFILSLAIPNGRFSSFPSSTVAGASASDFFSYLRPPPPSSKELLSNTALIFFLWQRSGATPKESPPFP